MANDLHEIDWVYVSEWLDGCHIPLLYCLCSSSHEISWNLEHRIIGTPWVLTLHVLDDNIANIVINMIQNGTMFTKHIMANFIVHDYMYIDPWYSSIHRAIELDKEAKEIASQCRHIFL